MYIGKLQNGWLFAVKKPVALRAFVFLGGRNSINHTTWIDQFMSHLMALGRVSPQQSNTIQLED